MFDQGSPVFVQREVAGKGASRVDRPFSGALAHNLVRWVTELGLGIDGPVVMTSVRRR